MKTSRKNILIIAIIAAVIAALLGYWLWASQQPGRYDDLAKCIKDSGAKFYGAFWCPHCQDQKTAFGSSQKHLPYVECSTPDGRGQLQVCKDANIKAYPTWTFANGSSEEGELTMEALAEKTGCEVPVN